MAAYFYVIIVLWVAWFIYWRLAAQNVKPATRRESAASRASHLVPLAVAVILLLPNHLPGDFLGGQVFADWAICEPLGTALVAAGLLFAVWARVHLARNWSATVTIKAGHELIQTGPYRLVRNPIYTGLLIAFIGSAIARNEWRGWLAVLIVLISLWRKLRIEERWLTEQFGETYATYRRKVRALIPFLF